LKMEMTWRSTLRLIKIFYDEKAAIGIRNCNFEIDRKTAQHVPPAIKTILVRLDKNACVALFGAGTLTLNNTWRCYSSGGGKHECSTIYQFHFSILLLPQPLRTKWLSGNYKTSFSPKPVMVYHQSWHRPQNRNYRNDCNTS
ncbi:MAG: hypothetical protein WBY88_15865, partial [Desulfosarcina sp.]